MRRAATRRDLTLPPPTAAAAFGEEAGCCSGQRQRRQATQPVRSQKHSCSTHTSTADTSGKGIYPTPRRSKAKQGGPDGQRDRAAAADQECGHKWVDSPHCGSDEALGVCTNAFRSSEHSPGHVSTVCGAPALERAACAAVLLSEWHDAVPCQ